MLAGDGDVHQTCAIIVAAKMMQITIGSVFLALSVTMLAFGQRNGYFPVSRPAGRVYRDRHPRYFWTLIAGYAVIGAIGIRILAV